MVQFGATLKAQRNKDWQEYYIDYHGLKGQLKALKAAYEEAEHSHPDTPQQQQQQGLQGWESSPLDLANRVHGFGGGGGSGGGGGGGGEMVSERSPSLQSVGGGEAGTQASAMNRMSFRSRLANRYSVPVGQEVGVLEERFSETLDSEVEKVVLFFLAKQGELAKLLLDAKQGVGDAAYYATPVSTGASSGGGGGGGETTTLMRAEDEEEGTGGGGGGGGVGYQTLSLTVAAGGGGKDRYGIYCAVGREIAELMRFLQLNVSGLRKILKKHDKQIRDKLIATNYLSTRTLAKYSLMRQLYNNAGVMALVGSLRKAFEYAEVDRIRSSAMLRAPEFSPAASAAPAGKDSIGGADEAGYSLFGRKLSLRSMRAAARSLSEISSTDGVFGEIASAQRALAEAQQLTTSKYLSRQVLLDGWELAAVDEGSERATARYLHRPSAYINLATTFLYMTNYYIVGPTSAEYAAALGGSPAVSGLIIGMTPIAACFSCLLYSWWTNTSFRGPLLLCSVINVFGNLLYGLALSYDAFWMVLVGRMLIGFGGARGVNRRYIADTIPIESRTAYSAAFVAVGALGMAFGPFFSAMMNGVKFKIAGIMFNGLTNPGWIMFIFWIIMGLIVHFEFQEPPHYMSSSSDVGSDEESAKNTPTHDRLSSKRAAVADYGYSAVRITAPTEANLAEINGNGGGVSGGGGGGSYGTTTTTAAAAAAASATSGSAKNGGGGATATVARKNGGKYATAAAVAGSQDNETAKLLPGGATVAAAAAAVVAGAAADGRGSKEGEEDEEESTGDGGGRYGALSAITPPLGFCLYGYFVNKLITEAAVSSAPVLTQYMFDWSVREVGLLMAVLGLVVLPVNATIGRLSMVYEDRVLLQLLAVLAGVGCIVMVDFSWLPFEYTETQYICGVSLVFVAMQAHEGVIMSVTSKIIPVELARGTWNSGFLATEAGTFGRFVGDAFITVLGVMTMDWLDFLLFVPSVFLVASMILGFAVVYPFLQGQ